MGPVWAMDAEAVKHRKNQFLATVSILESRVGKAGQDIDFFLIRVCCAYFDGNIFRLRLILGKPGRRESAIAKLMHHTVSLMKMVTDFDWVVPSRLIVFEPFNVVDVLIENAWGRCGRHH